MIARLACNTAAALTIAGAAFADPSTPQSARTQANDALEAVEFPSKGGPGGDFDWHLPAGAEVWFDTSYTLLRGGPGGGSTKMQHAFDGIVYVRDLVVPAGTTLRAQGPNPMRIYASGNVLIDGRISVNGGDASPVITINTPFVPEQGAPGNAGGGNGGTGSRYIDRADAVGGPGARAFGVGGIGGQGGESGWHPTPVMWGENRRAAGGGGGVFGDDVLTVSGCLDQNVIGLDAEDGFPGQTTANAALRPGELMPWGGRRGRAPFQTNDPLDDCFGRMIANAGTPAEVLVTGELPHPWAGAGGGGGGDATETSTYPPPTLVNYFHDKGAGGGGGAGALVIIALGDIVFGPGGHLSADGGHGSGGENTNYVNRIGGGSGGGSGGHILLSSLARIDLGQLPPNAAAITAFGGQGGAGANNHGGADTEPTSALDDAKHVGASTPNDTSDNPWIPPVPGTCGVPGQIVVRGAGGEGGPGVIQLHVRELSRILPPAGDPGSIRFVVRPAPVGYATVQAPVQDFVHLLLPTF